VTEATAAPDAVLEAFALEPSSITRIPTGLINTSFFAERRDGIACVLQRLNPIFPPAINDDIDAITRHLAESGVATPRLIRTSGDETYASVDDVVWRLLTRVPGETRDALESDAAAAEAGGAAARFHRALDDFALPLKSARPGVHDFERHLATLRQALERHARHRDIARIRPLAEQILSLAEKVRPPANQPARLVHGDLKISNVIFDAGKAVCLIDLDTVARMPVALEIGDALRSWCNPFAEDANQASFSLDRAAAALEGYAEAAPGFLTTDEWQAIPDATFGIAVELAARFAADALAEAYFGWDRARFPSAAEHNRIRAAGQLELARDIERQLAAFREAVMTHI